MNLQFLLGCPRAATKAGSAVAPFYKRVDKIIAVKQRNQAQLRERVEEERRAYEQRIGVRSEESILEEMQARQLRLNQQTKFDEEGFEEKYNAELRKREHRTKEDEAKQKRAAEANCTFKPKINHRRGSAGTGAEATAGAVQPEPSPFKSRKGSHQVSGAGKFGATRSSMQTLRDMPVEERLHEQGKLYQDKAAQRTTAGAATFKPVINKKSAQLLTGKALHQYPQQYAAGGQQQPGRQ